MTLSDLAGPPLGHALERVMAELIRPSRSEQRQHLREAFPGGLLHQGGLDFFFFKGVWGRFWLAGKWQPLTHEVCKSSGYMPREHLGSV